MVCFPQKCSLAIIQPLHKKGDLNVRGNYRSISLVNICSKLYSFVLNKRITKWIDDKEILHISYKDHVTNEEVRAKIQQAIGPHENLLTIVKRRKLQWYGHFPVH